MGDDIPAAATAAIAGPPSGPASQEPPPLDAIRIKAPHPRGVNKPAILIAVGVGVAMVLVMASGAFSPTPSRRSTEHKPIMSDPARPEAAQGAIRSLPATYAEAAMRAATPPAAPPQPGPPQLGPPQLGPPLPGDIAAFAASPPDLRGRASDQSAGWVAEPMASTAATPLPADDEDRDAERSALFFALRDGARQWAAPVDASTGAPQSVLPAAAPLATSALPASDRVLFSGAVITASLVTELNSEAPGPVIAQVTQSVYDSATGQNLLIPQGARLIGDYKSSTRYGQSRVMVAWQRLIMPDGKERALDEVAISPNGAAGLSGEVDNHWGDVFGAAALGTLINVGVATTEHPQITFSGIGTVLQDPIDQAVRDGVQRSASILTNRVVDRGLAMPTTIRVQAGARISVVVTRQSAF